MPTSFEQYEYAKLAQAGYIDFSGVAYASGATVAQEANDQILIPLGLAQQMFNEQKNRGHPLAGQCQVCKSTPRVVPRFLLE